VDSVGYLQERAGGIPIEPVAVERSVEIGGFFSEHFENRPGVSRKELEYGASGKNLAVAYRPRYTSRAPSMRLRNETCYWALVLIADRCDDHQVTGSTDAALED
jgi:hypothetical protein